MKLLLSITILSIFLLTQKHLWFANGAPNKLIATNKVFGYQDEMPIAEEFVEAPRSDKNASEFISSLRPEDLAAAQAACWDLIKERSRKFSIN